MSEPDVGHIPHPEMAPHYYGGQAVVEGVMMRGADTWAVAVRQPDDSIWVETHEISDLPKRRPWLAKPMIRGVYTLGDSLAIGTKALGIAADRAYEDEGGEELGSSATSVALVIALVMFISIFILLPSAATKGVDALLPGTLGDGALFHLVESVVRIAIFLGYLFAISLMGDIRRVFEYHGAEHKTIAAWEHDEVLTPDNVDKYSTVHVRCGTNFLIMVMLLSLVVYTVAGFIVPAPAAGGLLIKIGYHVALRIVLLPVVAGLAYEGLRLGASRGDNPLVKALVAPGLWLQKITTKPPDRDQIEVAIRSFEAVVPAAALAGRVPALPSEMAGTADTVPAENRTAADGTPPAAIAAAPVATSDEPVTRAPIPGETTRSE